MKRSTNRRGYPENVVEGRHLKLKDLKEEAQRVGLGNTYLGKDNIPTSPRPDFHVSHLTHDTDQAGLRGIRGDHGFKNPFKTSRLQESLLWWTLIVGPDEIASAERRLLEEAYPDRTEEQAQMQQSFLGKFATSPAFQKTSRLGSYRFSFPLEELLKAYSEQLCAGAQPVMRQLRTILYKQEVVHVVLVHSPANQELFSDHPLLTDDPNAVCTYKDGCFIWRPEAMSETHNYQLVRRDDEQQMEAEMLFTHQFYVWDSVAVALHVGQQVLHFDAGRLRETLSFCTVGQAPINRSYTFDGFSQAQDLVKELWPDDPTPLEG
ncbi:uncharacterized protein [Enoplosus armatus]|uniref:uncharacterized protein n=1 Tax=Enoplosus armatus TaxID=215367 RepID=UPI003993C599